MANSSASGGYLQPQNPPAPPLEGEQLEDFFHDLIVGNTGLDNALVRPSWQVDVPNIPVKGSVWIAFHFIDESSDSMPFVGQVTQSDGSVQQSELQRHEEFRVHCSIYGTGAGSNARAVAKLLRDNLSVPQNQEPLFNAGMALIEVLAPQPVPVLVKNIWQYRVDMPIRIRRIIVRDYDISTLQSADVTIIGQKAPDILIETTLTVAAKE